MTRLNLPGGVVSLLMIISEAAQPTLVRYARNAGRASPERDVVGCVGATLLGERANIIIQHVVGP